MAKLPSKGFCWFAYPVFVSSASVSSRPWHDLVTGSGPRWAGGNTALCLTHPVASDADMRPASLVCFSPRPSRGVLLHSASLRLSLPLLSHSYQLGASPNMNWKLHLCVGIVCCVLMCGLSLTAIILLHFCSFFRNDYLLIILFHFYFLYCSFLKIQHWLFC